MKVSVLLLLVASLGTLALGSDNSIEVTLEEPHIVYVYGAEVYAATRARGRAEAEKDIKAGLFRVRDWGNPSGKREFDSVTGYPIQRIGFWDHRSDVFEAEVIAYNQTMREWHAKRNRHR
jgi:hypothetical protein